MHQKSLIQFKRGKDKKKRNRRKSLGIKIAAAGVTGAALYGAARSMDRKDALKKARTAHSVSASKLRDNKKQAKSYAKAASKENLGDYRSFLEKEAAVYSNMAKDNKARMQTSKETISELRSTRIFGRRKKKVK